MDRRGRARAVGVAHGAGAAGASRHVRHPDSKRPHPRRQRQSVAGADIGIRGGRIVAMGRLGNAAAARVIDAHGLTVTPGFIDVHSHARAGLAGDLKEAGHCSRRA